MIYIGIDIGSTASKVAVMGDKEEKFVLPTGWSSKESILTIKEKLLENGIDVSSDDVKVLPISSLCTVFAESEVINYVGEGRKREDIAAGVVDSVANKVAQLAQKKTLSQTVILTGGLSFSEYITEILAKKIKHELKATVDGRYAGAIGAALIAKAKSK